jgi:hypothetical protein
MARPKRIVEDEPEMMTDPVTETITYIPQDGDRPTVTWCGNTFHANIPKDITGRESGTERERLNFHLIERARENKHFAVGGVRKKRDAKTEPKTQMEYRAYAIEWIKDPGIQHADQLIARFAKDRELQEACEIGYDDFAYLCNFFMPRLHELAKGDELNEPQVGQLWLAHGYNVLPW